MSTNERRRFSREFKLSLIARLEAGEMTCSERRQRPLHRFAVPLVCRKYARL